MTDKTPPSAAEAAEPAEAPPEGRAPGEQRPAREGDAPAGRPVVQVSPAVHKRLTTGLGGFALAMGACLLLVLAVYAVTPRSDEEVLPTVDYSAQLWAMRNDAPFTVHAPEGLPDRWRPTSSRLNGLGEGGGEPVAWHLGFVTPSDEYAALEQSNEKASEYVPRMTNSSKPLGTRQVNGQTWSEYHRKDKKANSLALTLPGGVSLVVTGTATYEELAILAGSLKSQSKDDAPLTPSSGAATPGF